MNTEAKFFDGKKIRNEIVQQLKTEVDKLSKKPQIAVLSVGEEGVCQRYVSLKQKVAEQIGIEFNCIPFPKNISEEELIKKIQGLNQDQNIDGIMVQIPLPEGVDKFDVVNAIAQKKDVDGLRFCGGFPSCFKPPVVLAILEAIERSGKKIEDSEVVIVGRGFLVGWPLYQCLEEAVPGLVVVDSRTKNLTSIIKDADILISATGQAGLIQSSMIKKGVVLIDAGTAEISGQLKGDISPDCYSKASYYTPVPGGIGPVTTAMLMKNLVEAAKK